LRDKSAEVERLREEVEKLAGEVEVLKGVVEEGLNERRAMKQVQDKSDVEESLLTPQADRIIKTDCVTLLGGSLTAKNWIVFLWSWRKEGLIVLGRPVMMATVCAGTTMLRLLPLPPEVHRCLSIMFSRPPVLPLRIPSDAHLVDAPNLPLPQTMILQRYLARRFVEAISKDYFSLPQNIMPKLVWCVIGGAGDLIRCHGSQGERIAT
jgi:hypothetical protein